MNGFDDEFGKYTDFGTQVEKTPEKDKQEHTPKQDVIEIDAQKQPEQEGGQPKANPEDKADLQNMGKEIEKEWLKAQQLDAVERSKKEISLFTNFLHNQEKTEATSEFQEQVAKMKACFSPEVEKMFTGYLVMRGMISEKQAQDYLNRLFPSKKIDEKEDVEENYDEEGEN